MLATMGEGGYGTFIFCEYICLVPCAFRLLIYPDASFCVVCALFGYFLCPETKGKTLEEMVRAFKTITSKRDDRC